MDIFVKSFVTPPVILC